MEEYTYCSFPTELHRAGCCVSANHRHSPARKQLLSSELLSKDLNLRERRTHHSASQILQERTSDGVGSGMSRHSASLTEPLPGPGERHDLPQLGGVSPGAGGGETEL